MPIPIATQNQVMSQLYPVIRIGSLQIGDFLSQYNSYSHTNYLIECLRIEREKNPVTERTVSDLYTGVISRVYRNLCNIGRVDARCQMPSLEGKCRVRACS